MAQDRYSYEELIADLAERQQQLAEVIRERDEFAHQLREAKSALAEEQNAQYGAYRQLVELERVRAFDDVARGIEHDLFNALTPVEGFTELLLINPERLADPAQARAYLNAIMSASKDARTMIERVREFYYSSNELDIDNHGSVSQVLAKALASNATGADGSGVDADLDEIGTGSLSPREWDVLRLLSEGLGSTEIAEALRISEATVRTHIKVVQGKLDLKGHSRNAAYELLDQQAFEA